VDVIRNLEKTKIKTLYANDNNLIQNIFTIFIFSVKYTFNP
jgi:hypothetical protein